MNLSKWPPEYDSVKVIVVIVIIILAGFFIFRSMHTGSVDTTGRVINTAVAPHSTQPTPSVPLVSILPASGISATAAMLNASVPTMDQSNQASFSFAYGLTIKYGSTVAPIVQAGKASATIIGLACGKTYHYRLLAQNAVGMSGSADKTFTTLACR